MENLLFATTPQRRILLIDKETQMTMYTSCVLTEKEFQDCDIPTSISNDFIKKMTYDNHSMDGGLLNDYFTNGRWSREDALKDIAMVNRPNAKNKREGGRK